MAPGGAGPRPVPGGRADGDGARRCSPAPCAGALRRPWLGSGRVSDVPSPRPTLAAEGILPAHFVFADEMKRDLAVLVLPSAAGVQVLSGQVPDPGDDRRPHAAVTQGRAGQRLGMVQTSRCPAGVTSPCLIGTGVEESVSAFAAVFPGRVLEGRHHGAVRVRPR